MDRNPGGSKRINLCICKTRCAMVKSRVCLGMGDLPPLRGNPYNGYMSYGRNYLFGEYAISKYGGPLSVFRVLYVPDINIVG